MMKDAIPCEVEDSLIRVVSFLQGCGLSVRKVNSVGLDSFLPNVQVIAGELLYTANAEASSMLHEAGHLAYVPSRFRRLMSDNLAVGMQAMWTEIESLNLHPDSALSRAALQCSDPEATAWAWAAGQALGLPAEAIIQDDEYGESGAEIRDCLAMEAYVGIHGLANAGMCLLARRPGGYPQMLKWLQDADV